MRLPRIAEPLRHRDFRLLWVGQTLTLLGSFISQVALPFQILDLGGSALELGTITSVFAVANLVFLLFGGAIADRVSRRALIVATELASGFVTAVIAGLGLAGRLELWHLYVLAASFGATTAFNIPALGAIIPELVPEDILVAGNALRGLSRQAARVSGPVVGGIIVSLAGPPVAFAFNATTFLLSAAVVWLTRPRPIDVRPRSSLLAEIREGFAFVFSVEWLWVTIFGFSIIVAGFIGAFGVGLPLLVTEVLRAGAPTFGLITAAMGVGEAAGAGLMGQIRIRRAGIAMYLFAALGGVALLVYGLVPSVPGALAASVILGLSFVSFGVLWESALQRHVPRALLGRVTSVDWFGGNLLGPVAPLGAALIANAYGPAAVFLVGGAIATGLCLAALALPSIRRLE